MITITQINTGSPQYAFVESLLHEAFPKDERRDDDKQRAMTDGNDLFKCCVISRDDTPIGLINYWDFGGYCYVEHFAVDRAQRNGGIGQEALLRLKQIVGKPLVLEVEMPTDDLSRRRIGFYQRQGLTLWDQMEYMQPPYRPGDPLLPMKLMATQPLGPESFDDVVQTIYRHVYAYEPNRPQQR